MFFRPSDPFVRSEPLHLGSKFEYFLTKKKQNDSQKSSLIRRTINE